MRFYFIFLLIVSSLLSYAQSNKIIKYYDSLWAETPKSKATFFSEFVKQKDYYNVTSYRIKTNKLESLSTFTDTNFKKGIGVQKTYNDKGILIDSSLFSDTGKINRGFHYYDNGKLYYEWHAFTVDSIYTKAFDENGNEIKNFIYYREASFPGGMKNWTKFLDSVMGNNKFHYKIRDNKTETRAVIISFLVDENGNVIDPRVAKTSGIQEIDNYAINAIAKSPKWNPTYYKNMPYKSFHQQPLKFEVTPE